jgi:hypothetical protein
MGLFRALADVVYKEYDRRVRRASLIKEYGVAHHDDHAGDTHAAEDEEHAAEDEAEIANVPRGTPIAATPPPDETSSLESA